MRLFVIRLFLFGSSAVFVPWKSGAAFAGCGLQCVGSYVNDRTVEPVKEHVIKPIKKHVVDPVTGYVSKRHKDSGPQGPQMSYYSIAQDATANTVINDKDNAYLDFFSWLQFADKSYFHFICETDAQAALGNEKIFYRPIGRAEFCRLVNRHYSSRLNNGYLRDTRKAACNSALTGKNQKYFRCWDSDVEAPEFEKKVLQQAQKENKEKISQLDRARETYNELVESKISDIDEKQADAVKAQEEAEKQNLTLSQDIAQLKEFIKQQNTIISEKISRIKTRLGDFDLKYQGFLDKVKQKLNQKYPVNRAIVFLLPKLTNPSLSRPDLSGIRSDYNNAEGACRELCDSSELKNHLVEIRVLHSNTKVYVEEYRKYLDELKSPSVSLSLDPYISQLMLGLSDIDTQVEARDQVYLFFNDELLDNKETCQIFKYLEQLIDQRENLEDQSDRVESIKELKDKFDRSLKSIQDFQKASAIASEAKERMDNDFKECLGNVSGSKLTEAMLSCDNIMDKLENIKQETLSKTRELTSHPEEDFALDTLMLKYQKAYDAFIKNDLNKGKQKLVRRRLDRVNVKVSQLKRLVRSDSALMTKEILPVLNTIIRSVCQDEIIESLPRFKTELELLAFDEKLSEAEESIDNLYKEHNLKI